MIRHPEALELAFEYLGLQEIPGPEHEAEIVQFFADVGHSWVKNDETAWCAAVHGSILKRTGYPYLKTLRARDYEDFGEEVEVPELGDIVVMWRISPTSGYGHIGFYLGFNGNYNFVLGGNQSNKYKVSMYSKNEVLSYRRLKK